MISEQNSTAILRFIFKMVANNYNKRDILSDKQ